MDVQGMVELTPKDLRHEEGVYNLGTEDHQEIQFTADKIDYVRLVPECEDGVPVAPDGSNLSEDGADIRYCILSIGGTRFVFRDDDFRFNTALLFAMQGRITTAKPLTPTEKKARAEGRSYFELAD